MSRSTKSHMIKNTKKLKIGFVIDDGLDRPDGVQQYVLTVGKWMQSQGHEVHYLAGNTARTDIKNVHSLARNFHVKFNGNGLTSPLPASKRKIKQLLESIQFDVLHIQVPYSPFFAATVVSCANPKTKVVGTFHILPYGLTSKIGNRILGFWLKTNLRRFDAQIAVSMPAKHFAQKTFRINPVVIPNAVDISGFYRERKKGNDYKNRKIKLVYLGRLVDRKGCMQFLEAIKMLDEIPKASYSVDIYGDGPLRDKLEKFVRVHNLSNIISFRGFVEEDKKPEVLANADIAVFPSTGGESFGIVLIEAMAAGTEVVIGGNNPGYTSVLQSDNRVLFNPYDVDEFSSLIKKLIEEPDLRKTIRESQRELVKQFDISTVGPQILSLYERDFTKNT